IERERRADARLARHADLAAEQPRDLAADGEAEARAAVLARGRCIGLLERLEDDALLLLGDADAGVDDAEGDDARSAVERVVSRRPPPRHRLDPQRHAPLLRELEGVAEQGLQ